jgi:PD-(D/E)XK nuclease superfamily
MSKFTLVLDSSQLSTYLECPQLWYYKYVKHLIPVAFSEGTTPAMNAGTYGHKLLDIYYRCRAKGLKIGDAIDKAISYDPDKDTCECGCADEYHLLNPILEEEGIRECQRCSKCLTFRPRHFDLDVDMRAKVLNRIREYFFKYQHNDFVALSPEHVEVGFSETIYEDDSNLFVLEGRMDLIGEQQGLRLIADHKFQLQTHWLYPHAIQFKNYALIAKANLFIINYIRLHQKMEEGVTLTRRLISYSQDMHEAWKRKLIDTYFKVKNTIQSKEAEHNWGACKGFGLTFKEAEPKYCYFNQLCECSGGKPMVDTIEKTLFKIRQDIWRPW